MDSTATDRTRPTYARARVPFVCDAGAGATGTAASTRRREFLKRAAGSLLLPAFVSPLLAACGGGGLDGDSDGETVVVRLASADNFRDVGGADGYPTADGRRVKRGVFYRSSALTLSDADKATLGTLGIAGVYDLRTPGEIARAADALPAGTAYATINIDGTSDYLMPAPASAVEAVAIMQTRNRGFVTSESERAAYGALLTQLASSSSGAQLFHGTAGKDRTGWAAALLLSIANVPLDVIVADYLLTNTYSQASIAARVDAIRQQGGDDTAASAAPLFNAQASHLQAGFDQVEGSYGTMTSYLTQGLGLAQSTVDALRARLVV
ncbi:tyrosine-protein phosphatase [Trinickia terrae]|uniref:Tyrosine-protein phosphatase n=1 Tax=Trinickia terrae TaxID=2571161 RepID=A0A4U1IFG1_9BURK|nr:tyrosine-protein phosphatase [Trinickia terrae]TKC92411.1 tyrosine-protein phosphatase [Trinickia terrae]